MISISTKERVKLKRCFFRLLFKVLPRSLIKMLSYTHVLSGKVGRKAIDSLTNFNAFYGSKQFVRRAFKVSARKPE